MRGSRDGGALFLTTGEIFLPVLLIFPRVPRGQEISVLLPGAFSVDSEHSGEKSHIRQTGSEHICKAGGIFHETEILIDGADGSLYILPGGSGHGRYVAAIKKDSPVPGVSMPFKIRNRVVFPAPDGPITETNSP